MPAIRRLVVLACLGLMAAACTQQEGGAVMGLPPAPAPTQPSPTAYDPSVIQEQLNHQIALYNSVPQGTPQVEITILTAREQDRLGALQAEAMALIDQRLNALSSLRGTVTSSGLGYGQQLAITEQLDATYAQVNQILSVIANEQMVSQARLVKVAIRVLNVLDVVLPSARKMLKAYDLLNLAAIYGRELPGLQQRINYAQSGGCDVTALQSAFNGLAVQSRAMTNDAYAILADVQSQTREGMRLALYPEAAGAAASQAAATDGSNARHAISVLQAQGC